MAAQQFYKDTHEAWAIGTRGFNKRRANGQDKCGSERGSSSGVATKPENSNQRQDIVEVDYRLCGLLTTQQTGDVICNLRFRSDDHRGRAEWISRLYGEPQRSDDHLGRAE